MIWSLCFVTRVRPGSDAEAKGLKPGGEILTINGTAPNRQNLWSIDYLDYVLDPRPEMQLQVSYPSGEKQKVEVKAKVTMSSTLAYRPGNGVMNDVIRNNENVRHRMRMQLVQLGDVGILKFPWFYYPVSDFYGLSGKIRKDQALIVDLRGDPGGAVETLKYFIGMFFDHDVKLPREGDRAGGQRIRFGGGDFRASDAAGKARHSNRGPHLGQRDGGNQRIFCELPRGLRR
jgi:C-terminal processing protease CtpA/Prc